MAKATVKSKKVATNGKAARFSEEDLLPKKPGKAGKTAKTEKDTAMRVIIAPLREQIAEFQILGTAPLMMCKFATAKFENMKRAQEAGSQKGSKKQRVARDFEADFKQASHRSRQGWYGVPCAAFRRGLIETCRMTGFKMIVAKMSIFIEADGYEATSGDPLVRLNVKEPRMDLRPARNANGSCDIRSRPIWDEWSATVRIRFDLDQFSLSDVANLLSRMGAQNGIGEGRANSSKSAGIGFGSFRIEME